MMKKNTQSGRSMIEMLAVLAIIGIISIGAIAALNQAMLKYRTSRTFTEIRAINQNAANLYSYLRQYPEGIANYEQLCQNGVFPTQCRNVNGETIAYNPFSGNYEIVFTADTMTIIAHNIPADACAELVNQNWGTYLVEDTHPACNGTDFVVTMH